MTDYLDEIQARADAASLPHTTEATIHAVRTLVSHDVPCLVAAIRAVEEVADAWTVGTPTDAVSVALDAVRTAIRDALEAR